MNRKRLVYNLLNRQRYLESSDYLNTFNQQELEALQWAIPVLCDLFQYDDIELGKHRRANPIHKKIPKSEIK